MNRSAKPATTPDRMSADTIDEIDNEFLGIWLDVARLREQVRALLNRAESRRSIPSIKSPAAAAAPTSPSAPCNP
jgi:hypothetical protein